MNRPQPSTFKATTPDWRGRRVVVIGLGGSGVAAAKLLLAQGALVTALDEHDKPALRQEAEALRQWGATVSLGCPTLPAQAFDLAIVSPGMPPARPLMRAVRERSIPVIGELELGYRHTQCPSIGITGTNGKTTTTELVERLIRQAGRRTVAAGNIGLPACAVADRTGQMDYLTLEISSFQLETVEQFHPVAAILLNLTPDHFDRYSGMADYIRTKARIFENQTADDWAIVQSEALGQMQALGLTIPSRLITFSAREAQASLYLEAGWIVSRDPQFPGRLLELQSVQLRGPHNAENLMAALAVGLVLGLDMDAVRQALQNYTPARHRCELIAEINGVKFINDSKATNVDAVKQALYSVEPGTNGEANIWLIAGGKDKGFAYDELGPDLASRVKGAILIGETKTKIAAAWRRFTPCTQVGSLLEAVSRAAKSATYGEVVLLSPACSSFDMFQNYQDRGDQFRQAVLGLAQPSGTPPPPAKKVTEKGIAI
jgi:UDP-N-acetylmuramoylalanine--D-glutamate ligase